MKKEEITARTYLERLSIGDVVLERHDPPDFSIASTIGIEVRRLNENYSGDHWTEGLENLEFSLRSALREVLSSYDSQYDGLSYHVGINFMRPLQEKMKKYKEDMCKALDGFLNSTRTTPCDLKANENIFLQVISGSSVPHRVFCYGGIEDEDSGKSPVVELYSENISYAINVKSQEIVTWKKQYSKRWLLLVDTIMFWDLDPDEVHQVRFAIPNIGNFDKLIVVDHCGDKCLLEIP